MKKHSLVLFALIFTISLAFISARPKDKSEKLIVGTWCSISSGQVKGYNLLKDGSCKAINIPVLELKNWELKNGMLTISGVQIAPDGSKSEYRDEQKVVKLTKDSLILEAEAIGDMPSFIFAYIPEKVAENSLKQLRKQKFKTDPRYSLLVGEWCNPSTYSSQAEIKGFYFGRSGNCRSLNIPTLELETWEIEGNYLIINGFVIKNNIKEKYIQKEKILKVTADSLTLKANTPKDLPEITFTYIRPKAAKKIYKADAQTSKNTTLK